MKKWYDEEYAFTIEVTGFLRVIIRSIIAAAAAIGEYRRQRAICKGSYARMVVCYFD